MFYLASSFNQDLSSWDISQVNNFNSMFNNTALNDTNRCAIHTTWSSNQNWPYDWFENCVIDGYTYVPDDNFEQALIDLGYDDTLDN